MAGVQWVRLSVDIFDNRKIKHIRRYSNGNVTFVIWVLLLTLAGQCNDNGRIWIAPNVPYDISGLAMDYGFAYNDIDDALKMFSELNMVEISDGFITVLDWENHQNIEGMERIREGNRERQKRFRDKHKVTENVTESVTENVTLQITPNNGVDKNRIDKNRIEKNIYNSIGVERGAGETITVPADEPPKLPRHKYGEYKHVLLTDPELEKLKSEFPTDWEQRIERLDSYIESKGVTYKNHLATIRNWARKDKEQNAKIGGDNSRFEGLSIGETY